MVDVVGLIGSLAMQIIGSIVVIRWVWRESSEGGRIDAAISRWTNRLLDWWIQ